MRLTKQIKEILKQEIIQNLSPEKEIENGELIYER